ncbi:E3 ubiquitin-protein ligase At3g02290-like [Cynara cardunculus var. scolymus]|uniref:RING-type E3 ubiquitin transferase n=1 Tax=Cynara cardunculus var. scolymus TaxID=59895 RepID=A0A103XV69_CYNCS|nr:E3 ubiquitin-protein ligase At3g02290-like [Cynara cardunculus var. scolymus]KVH97473.1 Zinc finger, RING/FYVE/PHD-type [Cynara cardunculus var. scolymus]
MGSLLCCLRGSAIDEEDVDSNDNEQVQESNNTTDRSTPQAGFNVFAHGVTKMCNDLFGSGVAGSLQSSSSIRDAKSLNHSDVEPELARGSSGLTFTRDEDCESSKDDECLICLEEYTSENPRITTKCLHDSHLSCILEWQQRSELCPVCAKLMEFEEMS